VPLRYGALTHGHARNDVVHQIRGRLRHAARAARRADAAPLAAKGHQRVARAALAAQAQKAVGQDATIEIGLEFVFDELRQARYLGSKRLIVLLHQAIQRGLFGAAALVAGRIGGGFAQQRGTHEGVAS
jgi:uncharacterized membrane protein (DUF4010 family)